MLATYLFHAQAAFDHENISDAVVMVIVPIGWLGVLLGLPLWVLTVSVLLFRRAASPVSVREPPPERG